LERLRWENPEGQQYSEECTAKATFGVPGIPIRNAISIVYTFSYRWGAGCEDQGSKKNTPWRRDLRLPELLDSRYGAGANRDSGRQ
jgi:hypothetical protein